MASSGDHAESEIISLQLKTPPFASPTCDKFINSLLELAMLWDLPESTEHLVIFFSLPYRTLEASTCYLENKTRSSISS